MDSLTDDEIRETYGYIPRRMETGMVSIFDEDAPQLQQTRPRGTAMTGTRRLNALPVEILHLILEELDFLSLSRFSRTSRRGCELATSLPAYHDLLRHAPKTLAALSKMTILHLHKSKTLRRALYSDQCVCCGNFGAFLFLITCQRCCFQCLATKQAVWAMPRAEAAKCFDIAAKEPKLLPSARSLPGGYYVKFHIERSRPQRLVSVAAAKKLALKLHGGTEASLATHLRSRPAQASSRSKGVFTHLRRAQLVFQNHDPRIVCVEENATNDFSNGMASILFPVVRRHGNTANHGTWCRGCQWFWRDFHLLPKDVVARIVPQSHAPSSFCYTLALREWSNEGFIDHAKSCYGLQYLAESRQHLTKAQLGKGV